MKWAKGIKEQIDAMKQPKGEEHLGEAGIEDIDPVALVDDAADVMSGYNRYEEEEDCDIELGGCKGGDKAQAKDGAGGALSSYKKGLDCAGARRVCMERGGEPLRLVWRIREE